MDIGLSKQGAVTVVRPSGALAGPDCEPVAKCLREVIDNSMGRMVLDASAVAYVDSTGLEVLLDTAELLAERGQSLRMCSAPETLREVLELTDIGPMFEHYTDVNTGVRSFL